MQWKALQIPEWIFGVTEKLSNNKSWVKLNQLIQEIPGTHTSLGGNLHRRCYRVASEVLTIFRISPKVSDWISASMLTESQILRDMRTWFRARTEWFILSFGLIQWQKLQSVANGSPRFVSAMACWSVDEPFLVCNFSRISNHVRLSVVCCNFNFLHLNTWALHLENHVSSESEHLRNSDKFFLSSSGIRAWLVLVPKGCKSSKPDKVPRRVSIPTHTKLWKRFKFQQPFDKINGWNRKFHYRFKIIVEYQRKPSELRLVGFSIWTELQKWRCLELPGPFFTTWTPISAFGKDACLVLASLECVSTIFCFRV